MKSREGVSTLHLKASRIGPLQLSPDDALAIARRQIAATETWTSDVVFQDPRRFKGDWLVVVHHDVAGKLETRSVLISPAGTMRYYLRVDR